MGSLMGSLMADRNHPENRKKQSDRKVRMMQLPYSAYYYSTLSGDMKRNYMAIADGMLSFASTVFLPCPVSPEDLSLLLTRIRLDLPQIFWLADRYSYSRASDQAAASCLTLLYRYTRKQSEELNGKLEEAVRKIQSLIFASGQPSAEAIEEHLHRILVRNIEYGYPPSNDEDAYCLIGPLIYHKGVCAGISAAFKYLSDRCHLHALTVTGSLKTGPDLSVPQPHAWNMVSLRKQRCHLDVTNNGFLDPSIPSPPGFSRSQISHIYYNLSTSQILKTHVPNPALPIPDCPKSLSPIPDAKKIEEVMVLLRSSHPDPRCPVQIRILFPGYDSLGIIREIQDHVTVSDCSWYSQIKSFSFADGQDIFLAFWK